MSDANTSTANGLYLKVQGDAVAAIAAWDSHETGLVLEEVDDSPNLVLATGDETSVSALGNLLGAIKGFRDPYVQAEVDSHPIFLAACMALFSNTEPRTIYGTAIMIGGKDGDVVFECLKIVKLAK